MLKEPFFNEFDHLDPNTSLGFFNHVSIYPKATQVSGKLIRIYHPNAKMFMSLDGNADVGLYTNLAQSLNIEMLVNKKTIGYPQQQYGYRLEFMLEWLTRLYVGVVKLNTSHVMLWEDDLFFRGPVQFNEDWSCAGHNITVGNEIHPSVRQLIEDFSGKKPTTKRYNCGGGTIFKRAPLIAHFDEIYKWFEGNLEWIQNGYFPQLGWSDCFMTVIYLMCGCEVVSNPFLYNLDPQNNLELILGREAEANLDGYFIDKKLPHTIIHGYKHFY